MSDQMKRWATLIALLVILDSIMYTTSRISMNIDWMVLIAFPFASSMAARAISYLDIFEWLRRPFTKITPHSSGVGECVEPDGGPIRHTIGGLLSCTNCTGMWSAALLMLVYAISPAFGKVLIICLGVASLGILVTKLIELVEWKSHLAHEDTGFMNRANRNKSDRNASVSIFPEAEKG